MNQVKIKKLGLTNLEQLKKIAQQTFVETYLEGNAGEEMQKYVEERFSTDKLSLELSNPHAQFFVAMLNDQTVGYLKINFGDAQTEVLDKTSVEIKRIYVFKEYHGKKVGQVLYNMALDIAKQMNVDYLWLGVWEENTRAINFYKKNGFVEFDKHIFKFGDDEQTDIMMKLNLT